MDSFIPQPLPNRVYKYMRINDYFWDLLSTHSLWFAHQNELNDPFDCKFAISESMFDDLIGKGTGKFLHDLREQIPAFKSITESRFKEIMEPELKSEEWRAGFYKMVFGRMGWYVCCFTTSPLNELMWAHYGANSTGVCLEFDFASTKDFEGKIHPVTYNNELVTINTVDDIMIALLRKREAWRYEEEWRTLSNVGGKKEYNPNALTAVHFGANVMSTTINRVRDTMISSGFTQCHFDQVNFNFNGVRFSTLRETIEP